MKWEYKGYVIFAGCGYKYTYIHMCEYVYSSIDAVHTGWEYHVTDLSSQTHRVLS